MIVRIFGSGVVTYPFAIGVDVWRFWMALSVRVILLNGFAGSSVRSGAALRNETATYSVVATAAAVVLFAAVLGIQERHGGDGQTGYCQRLENPLISCFLHFAKPYLR